MKSLNYELKNIRGGTAGTGKRDVKNFVFARVNALRSRGGNSFILEVGVVTT